MQVDLRGKRAVVTGSTAGIGLAIAQAIAGSGAEVVVNGRTEARTEAAMAAIRAAVPTATVTGVAADVGTAEGCATLVERVPETDILVNNMGIFDPKPFLEIEDAEWLRFFEVNVLSGVRLSRAYLASMMAKGWGRIVFISSESALHIPPEMIHYGMTKTAQLAVSRGLAETAAGTGVTVNAVLPGPTRSEGVLTFLEKMAGDSGKPIAEIEADFIAQHRPTSIIRRFAEVEEIANMVLYAVSKEASATTGAALRVDGGLVRAIP